MNNTEQAANIIGPELTPAEGWLQYKMNSMAKRSAVTPPATHIHSPR